MNLPGFQNIEGLTPRAKRKIDLVLDIIQKHRPDNVMPIDDYPSHVQSPQLEQAFHLNGSEIRAIINALRQQGEPIGSDSKGYFYAETAEQLQVTIDHLSARAASISVALAGIRRAQRQLLEDNPQTRMAI